MNRKILETYKEIAARTGLSFDEESSAIYGTLQGYSVFLYASNTQYPFFFQLKVAAHRANPLGKDEQKNFKSTNKQLQSIDYNNNIVTVTLKNAAPKKVVEITETAILESLTFISQHGFTPCCQACGKECTPDAVSIQGNYMLLCDECYTSLQQNTQLATEQQKQKKENIVGGIVGALLGSLLGAVSIILLSQLGYVAAISGLIMAICTLKGYEMLGGKITKKGIVFALIIMLGMTYAADRLDWAIVVARELEEDLFLSYQAIPALLNMEIIPASNYYGSLVMVYLFVILGAFSTVRQALMTSSHTPRTYRFKDGAYASSTYTSDSYTSGAELD